MPEWIPAFAGMTRRMYLSFPRMRESICWWMPAFAGMTGGQAGMTGGGGNDMMSLYLNAFAILDGGDEGLAQGGEVGVYFGFGGEQRSGEGDG
jgi:hypothetical protein